MRYAALGIKAPSEFWLLVNPHETQEPPLLNGDCGVEIYCEDPTVVFQSQILSIGLPGPSGNPGVPGMML